MHLNQLLLNLDPPTNRYDADDLDAMVAELLGNA